MDDVTKHLQIAQTRMNDAADPLYSVRGAVRHLITAIQELAIAQSPATPTPSWYCSYCKLHNLGDVSSCRSCKKPRDPVLDPSTPGREEREKGDPWCECVMMSTCSAISMYEKGRKCIKNWHRLGAEVPVTPAPSIPQQVSPECTCPAWWLDRICQGKTDHIPPWDTPSRYHYEGRTSPGMPEIEPCPLYVRVSPEQGECEHWWSWTGPIQMHDKDPVLAIDMQCSKCRKVRYFYVRPAENPQEASNG